MVYCGKPSKACAECRARRTRCDLLRPSCSQCRRAGRTCTGYRDLSDLMFRDEAKALNTKHRNRLNQQNGEARGSQQVSSAAQVSARAAERAELQNAVIRTFNSFRAPLTTPAEEQAACFFFRNYTIIDCAFTNGHFQYVYDMMNDGVSDPALTDSVACLGMAGLSHLWKAPIIMTNAKVKYNSALRQLSTRLRDIEQAKSDSTLASVMLLGLYEINTCNSPQSMKSWTKHVSGAAALLHLRGKQQLKESVGYQLFVHLRAQIIINCLQRHAAVPPIISEWSQAAMEYESSGSRTIEEVASTRLTQLIIKFCSLRSSMEEFHDYSNTEQLVAESLSIDAELANWAVQCPVPYIYKTISLRERNPAVFSDHYHVYTSITIAALWNHYRCTRILLNEIIVTQLEHQFKVGGYKSVELDRAHYEGVTMSASATVVNLAHEVCSSVPYFLGHDPNRTRTPGDDVRTQAVAGNLLLWPLYTAACTEIVSDVLRDWVAGQLRMIAELMGIQQALPMAHVLTRKEEISDWQEMEDIGDNLDIGFRKRRASDSHNEVVDVRYGDAVALERLQSDGRRWVGPDELVGASTVDRGELAPERAEEGLTNEVGQDLEPNLDLEGLQPDPIGSLEGDLDSGPLEPLDGDLVLDAAAGVAQPFVFDLPILFESTPTTTMTTAG